MAKKTEADKTIVKTEVPNQAISTEVMTSAELNDMYGDLGKEHVTIPRLVILEQMNPEVGDKLGEAGDFFVKSLNRNLGKGPLEVVVLMRSHSRMSWKDISSGGGILCQATDGKRGIGEPGGFCESCTLKEWSNSKDPQTGNMVNLKPRCDLYENFIVVLRNELQQGEAFPVAISGSRTRLKGLKDFNTILMQLIQKRRPLFSKSYVIKTVQKTNPKIAGNNKYHVFQISVGNENALLPEAEQQEAMSLFKSFAGRGVVIEQDAPQHEEGPAGAGEGKPGF